MAAEIKITISTSNDGGLDKAKKDVADLGDAAKNAGGGFSSLKEIAVGALREVGALAVDALGMAAKATVGFLKDSVSIAGDFQAGMQEFQAVAGQSIDTAGLEQFHDLFIQIGKDLPVSTSDVQQAAIELVKGGIDPATIAAGGLEQSIKFAAAAMDGDLKAAAEVSAKVVGGWADVNATAADKADLLTHSTDLLTKAANASTVDVHDLALGLYNVQGTAKTAGLSLDETTTALAELAPRFSNANTAGTAFRNFLIRMQPTTAPATEAMQGLGLMTTSTTKIMKFLSDEGIAPLGTDLNTLRNQFSDWTASQKVTVGQAKKLWEGFASSKFFDDASGKFVGVAQASELLQEATAGLTDAEKTMALQTIFGNDAMGAAAAFAEMGADGYTNMTAALENANGVQANAALKQQGFNTALENAKGSIEALQITIGEKLLPVLAELLNTYIAPAINQLTTLASAIFGDQAAFDALSPTLQILITQIDALVTGFQEGGLAGALQQLQLMLFGTNVSVESFLATLAEISPMFSLVLQVAQAVWPTLSALIDAVLATINASFATNGASMLATVQATWTTIQQTISALAVPIAAIIQAFLGILLSFWQAHGTEVMAFLQQTWTTINEIIQVAMALIQAIIVPVLQFIASFIQAHGSEIQAIISNTWTIISGLITAALGLIKGIITAALQLIKGDFSGAWETIKTMSANFVTTMYNVIKAGLDNVTIYWEMIWGGLKQRFEAILNSLVGWVIQTMAGIIQSILQAAAGAAGAAQSVGSGIISGIQRGISAGVSGLVDAAVSAVRAALSAAKSALGIASPSKLFADQIGLPIAQGMAMGMGAGTPMVAGAGAGMAASAYAGARTYNQQRSVNLTQNYHGVPAAPAMDYAMANSLAGV